MPPHPPPPRVQGVIEIARSHPGSITGALLEIPVQH